MRTRPARYPVRHKERRALFGLFHNAVLADVNVVQATPPAPISPALVRALLCLERHEDCALTVSELAEGLGLTLGRASRIADELVRNGLIDRVRGRRDRRVVLLQLSKRALKISKQLCSNREKAVVAALGGVAPRQRVGIAVFLQRLTAELGRRA